MKNLDKLNTAAVYGSYDCGVSGVLFLFKFKDESFYCFRTKNKVVIPTKFTEKAEQVKDMFDFARTLFDVNKSSIADIRDLVDFEKVISGVRPPVVRGVIPVSLRVATEYLASEGFDVSALEREVPEATTTLDYSGLMNSSPIAVETFNRIKAIVDSKHAVIPNEYMSVADSIKSGKNRLVYLVGPAGTGKTMLAYLFSQYCGAPLITYQGSEGVEKDELIGCSDVNPDAQDGESPYRIVMGPLLRAYIEGWQIVIDEANYLLPSIMSCVNSMVDDTPTYEFKGKVYQRHPNFVLYLTSNPGYEGTYQYNPATKSRGLTLLVDRLTPQEFAKRLRSYTEEKLSESFFIELNKVAAYVQEQSLQCGETSAVCLRQAQNFCNLILQKPLTQEEFNAAFRIAYLCNALSMDQDNSVKIADICNNPEFSSQLELLFSKYDFACTPDIDPTASFGDFDGEDTLTFDETSNDYQSSPDFEKSFNEMFNMNKN